MPLETLQAATLRRRPLLLYASAGGASTGLSFLQALADCMCFVFLGFCRFFLSGVLMWHCLCSLSSAHLKWTRSTHKTLAIAKYINHINPNKTCSARLCTFSKHSKHRCRVGVLPGRFCRGAEGLVEPPALDAGSWLAPSAGTGILSNWNGKAE